jgi:hypothetical protein
VKKIGLPPKNKKKVEQAIETLLREKEKRKRKKEKVPGKIFSLTAPGIILRYVPAFFKCAERLIDYISSCK